MHTDVQQVGDERLERVVAIRNEVVSQDPASVAGYLDWRRQAEDAAWFLAFEDDREVGAGLAVHGWHSPPGVGRLAVFVPAAHRGEGAGTALLRATGAWLVAKGCASATSTVEEDDPASLAWAERRGFTEIGRESILALDLTRVDAPAVDPPAGVEIVTWADRDGLEPGMHAVYLEAARDVPGEDETELLGLEEWLSADMRGASDKPEATFVALASGEVVGYAKLAIPTTGGDVAWHDLTGVLRAWRGRGVAGALKRAEIAWAKRQGFRHLNTLNEERNEPIRRLNERHGYEPRPGTVRVQGTLVSGGS